MCLPALEIEWPTERFWIEGVYAVLPTTFLVEQWESSELGLWSEYPSQGAHMARGGVSA